MRGRTLRGPRVRGLLAAIAVALPVAVGVAYAGLGALGLVGPGAGGGDGPRLDRLGQVLTESAVWRGTLWSLWVAAASTTLATLGAAGVAVVYRGETLLSRGGRSLAILPLAVPHVAAAVAALLILGQSGLLARIVFLLGWIQDPAGMPALVMDPWGIGLVLALTWKELPFLALVAASVLATRGSALEETAQGLGAGRISVFCRVTWPMLWRGMLPAAVAVFAFVAGSYEATVLLAPSDPLALPLLTWERYTDAALSRRGDAYVLALLGMALAGLAVALHEWLASRDRGEAT